MINDAMLQRLRFLDQSTRKFTSGLFKEEKNGLNYFGLTLSIAFLV